jgi:SAM-dependent methyltransferase
MYTTSATHTDPQVLGRVVELACPERHWIALDIGTGPGHTAFAVAPHLHEVIAIDLTREMLAEAALLRSKRELPNVELALADAHNLPCADAAFDLVTCRRTAHHLSDIAGALREMKRVLRPGGRLVIDDRSVPEDDFVDACMNELDRYHDESHVRQYRPSEWREMLEARGFRVEEVEPYTQHRPLTSLTDGVSPQNVERIHRVLNGLTDEQRHALNFVEVDGERHCNHWYVMLSARDIAP